MEGSHQTCLCRTEHTACHNTLNLSLLLMPLPFTNQSFLSVELVVSPVLATPRDPQSVFVTQRVPQFLCDTFVTPSVAQFLCDTFVTPSVAQFLCDTFVTPRFGCSEQPEATDCCLTFLTWRCVFQQVYLVIHIKIIVFKISSVLFSCFFFFMK